MMISKRKSCIWPMVAAALFGGCGFGPFASRRTTPPVRLPTGEMMVAPRPLTGDEIKIMWGGLASEGPLLMDQVAGIEGVPTGWAWCAICRDNVRLPHNHTSGTPGDYSGKGMGEVDAAKLAVLLGAVVLCFLLIDYMMVATTPTY